MFGLPFAWHSDDLSWLARMTRAPVLLLAAPASLARQFLAADIVAG
jgi:hypothetical protein